MVSHDLCKIVTAAPYTTMLILGSHRLPLLLFRFFCLWFHPPVVLLYSIE